VTVEDRWPGLWRELRGSRVVLEPLAPEHEAGLFEAARHPEVWRWICPYPAGSRERFHAWVQEALALARRGEEAPLATVEARTGAPVGSTRYLTLRPADRGLEIGWTWLTPSAWRTGANVEAKLLMLAHAFEDLGCIRVEFKTHAANERSRVALTALPARFEGIWRKHRVIPEIGIRDSAFYSVIDDEWPEVRANLQRRLEAADAA
jgi:RimJ/RimL family protein N-acetyltransferase